MVEAGTGVLKFQELFMKFLNGCTTENHCKVNKSYFSWVIWKQFSVLPFIRWSAIILIWWFLSDWKFIKQFDDAEELKAEDGRY